MGIFVTPIEELSSSESIKINVTASTSVPYQKTISCSFTLKPELQGTNEYTIEDAQNNDYAILKLTCPSSEAIVTIELDPTQVRIDTNDELYIKRDDSKTEYQTIDGKNYVKKFVFIMPEETTRYVKFYKVDRTQNYSYPGFAEEHPIKVTI